MSWPRRIVALDLETTGLVANYDYIVQIGAAVMGQGQVVGAPFYSRVQPSLDKLKVSLGSITAMVGDLRSEAGGAKCADYVRELIDSPPAREVAMQFAGWASDSGARDLPVVAHNASFDHAFWGQFAFQQKAAMPVSVSPVWICTMEMAKRAWPTARKYGLDECLISAELPARPEGHDALQDAILAGRLYSLMVERLSKPEGPK